MKKITFLFLTIGFSIFSLFSQTTSIKGRVIAEDFEILPLVSIVINDTTLVGRTDENGRFKVDIPISVKKLLFLTVGMEPTTVITVENCNLIEVVMMNAFIYDFVSSRHAERLRKKRFKKLTEIHKLAFDKGIFETIQPCYIRER